MSDKETTIAKTIIGGGGKVQVGLDIDVSEGAKDANSSSSKYTNIFDDLAKTLEINNEFPGKIFNSERNFIVPGYQRNYTWDDSNHEELWRTIEDMISQLNEQRVGDNDIIDLSSDDTDEKFNESFFGPIYIAESEREIEGEEEEIYEVIDGQQRLATLFILLNEIRHRLKEIETSIREKARASNEFDGEYVRGIEYLRRGIVSNTLFDGSHNDGKSRYLRLELGRHDKQYFQTIFEDSTKDILQILSDIERVESPEWKRVDNILRSLDTDPERLNFDLDSLEITMDDDEANFNDFLKTNLYFATQGSHNNLFNAKNTYGEYIDELLNKKLGFDDEAFKERATTLLNLAVLLLVSFRVIECKFEEPVDDSMKIDVFKSLNETGQPLNIVSKVRARVVNKFGIGNDRADKYEEIVELFDDNSDIIEQYLIDYILATEKSELYRKDNVRSDLLQFFSLREKTTRDYQSRLAEVKEDEERESPEEFMDNLHKHAEKYKIISEGGDIPQKHISNQSILNECNNILNDLSGTQWRPFALRLYIDLTSGSAIVSPAFFRDMLRRIENIMMRNSFATGAATAIDTTFIGACLEYNNQSIPDFDNIDEYENKDEDWMESDEFSNNTRQIMEAHLVNHSSWNQISGTDIVRNMHGTSWKSPKLVLQLLARRNLADEIAHGGAIERAKTLDFSDTELEHVLPEEPRIDSNDPRSPSNVARPLNWYCDFFQLEDEEGREQWHNIAEKYDDLTEKSDPKAEEYERLRNLAEHIINDIGNQILLENGPNNALRNTQFSVKGLGYYLTLKQDLRDFGEYISDPNVLKIDDAEIIRDAECLGSKLGTGETRVLLHETIRAFDQITMDEVNQYADTVQLNDSSKLDPSEFSEHYDTPADLFEEFALNKTEYSSLFEEWSDYEYDDAQKGLVSKGSDETTESISPAKPINRMTEKVLIRIVSSFDVTNPENSPESVCKMNDEYIISRFNAKWNWKRVVCRKVDIIENFLDEIKMITLSDEFEGLDEDYHRENVTSAFKYA